MKTMHTLNTIITSFDYVSYDAGLEKYLPYFRQDKCIFGIVTYCHYL